MWFRQLEHCSVHAQTGLELALLAEGLQRAGPIALRALHLADWRAPDARDAAPASVPALANLPRLGTLVSWPAAAAGVDWLVLQPLAGSWQAWRGAQVGRAKGTTLKHAAPAQKCTNCLPESVWLCRHLTRLLCSDGDVELGKQATVLCTGLQQLDLRNCTLPDGVFPAALCSLGQLISVRLIRGQLLGLSPAFSKLRRGGGAPAHGCRAHACSAVCACRLPCWH